MRYTRKRRPISKRPTFNDVALNITFACNLSCVGCDRASFIKPTHSPAMTPDRLRAFFDEVCEAGIVLKRIRIVGGEPTLHPDFPEMTAICMAYARSVSSRCNVRVFSNKHTKASRELIQRVSKRHPRLQLMGAHKRRSTVFPPMTRYEYVSPGDVGIECRHPCPNMGGRGKCGSGVDQLGCFLCPTAGPINSILKLGAEATVRQMLNREFMEWQADTICSHCGNFMAYTPEELPRLWNCNGTPVSKTYRDCLVESGFKVDDQYDRRGK